LSGAGQGEQLLDMLFCCNGCSVLAVTHLLTGVYVAGMKVIEYLLCSPTCGMLSMVELPTSLSTCR
jgi:hypothetical protein